MKTPTNFEAPAGSWWNLALTIANARRLKDDLGVDIGDVEAAFRKLGSDPYSLASTLWILCESQAKLRNIEGEQFAEQLTGDVLDAAFDALGEAIVLFSRAPARGAMRNLLKATSEAQAAGMRTIESWVEASGEDLQAKVVEATTRALQQFGSESPS